ncbi:MAG: MMPL family transporter [Flavobacteriales bacterium]
MAYEAQFVRMSYRFAGILPEDDSTYIEYEKFTKQFSQDGNVLVIGYRDPAIWQLENFNKWKKLGEDLKKVQVHLEGESYNSVDSIFSTAHCYKLLKDTTERRFKFVQIAPKMPTTQAEVTAIRDDIYSLPFYRGLLYNDSTDAGLMMVFVNSDLFNSEKRGNAIQQIVDLTNKFSEETGVQTHISGLPFIRTEMTTKVKAELGFFTLLSAFICIVLLYGFFRSFKVTWVVMSVVVVAVVTALGTIALFDYPISVLMGLIPPLMIVTSVPNCIYIVTKYHQEYKKSRHKTRSLVRVYEKAGSAAFMINATTAVGFATFIFTSSDLLKHFGVIATINSLAVFFLSMVIIPIVYSFMSPPIERHLGHLDANWMGKSLDKLAHIVSYKRRSLYIVTVVILGLGFLGISMMHTTGNIVDDLPDEDRVIVDLKWFEHNFRGVMPFEIMVDGNRKGQITRDRNLAKIEDLQELLLNYQLKVDDTLIHPFSKSLSIADASKFVKQAFYNGDPDYFTLITRNEQSFIGPYLQNEYQSKGIEKTFIDSTKQMTRVTVQIADIGTTEMDRLMKDLKPRIDSIFPTDKYHVTLTGTSVIFLEGTNYLLGDLFKSLLIGIIVISLMMALMFWSARMVIISFIPNIIPQIMTAGLMGFMNIPLKPSTILVFSIALGIAVNDTIHYLAKYRQELRLHNWSIKESALRAIKESGSSMVYTSLVLLFGFGCFAASEFDGTRALGVLTAVTLFVAMFTNLILLPALLLSFQKSVTTKAFKEPFFRVLDEEDDLHYEDWTIQTEEK